MLGPLSEALLGAMCAAGGAGVAGRVAALREATKAAARELAARKRAAMLASMGMLQVRAFARFTEHCVLWQC